MVSMMTLYIFVFPLHTVTAAPPGELHLSPPASYQWVLIYGFTWRVHSQRREAVTWRCRQPAGGWGRGWAAADPCRSCWTWMPWTLAHGGRWWPWRPSTGSTWSLEGEGHWYQPDQEHRRPPSWGHVTGENDSQWNLQLLDKPQNVLLLLRTSTSICMVRFQYLCFLETSTIISILTSRLEYFKHI